MRKTVTCDRAPAAVGPYAQAVICDGWIFVSGQIALDPQSGELVGDSAAEQAVRALDNLAAVLEAAGAGLQHVVRATVYLTDLEQFQAVNQVYARYFGQQPPARVCVEVSRLPKDALVEIDVVARL